MKYQKELEAIPQCPPADAVPKKNESFRFVFDPLCSRSFTPQGMKDPVRVSNENEPETKCSLMGLSFFISAKEAVRAYKNIRIIKKRKKANIGSHLAQGLLDERDGLQTKVKGGHFDLHEFKDVTLENKFKIIGPL